LNLPIWDQCIAQLESELSEQQFNTWILPLQVELINNELNLLAPNRFVMDWVKKNFLQQITDTIRSLDDSKSLLVNIGIGSHRTTANQPGTSADTIVEENRTNNFLSGLDASQTFDNYVEGKSNQLARAASIQVSNHPGADYNPLYVYGGVGLGKTHLMQAIGNQIKANNPDSKVV